MQISGEIPLHGCFLVSPCNEYTKKEVMFRTAFCLDMTKYHLPVLTLDEINNLCCVQSTDCKHNYAVYNNYYK